MDEEKQLLINDFSQNKPMRKETRAIHVGEEPLLGDKGFGDVVSPIHLSSTFAREKVMEPTRGYEYSRTGNPTRDALEKRLAALENGQYAVAFSSGMAAITSFLLMKIKPRDHVIAFNDLYGGTKRIFDKVFHANYNIEFSYVDATRIENVEKAIKSNTKLVWLETPTNPLLKLCNIHEISRLAHENNLQVLVDNTFMSPYFQNPLDLGADFVLHSTTKYINGHSDSVGGAIITNNPTDYEKLKFIQNAAGAVLSPFDSFLVLRGSKTLHVRMKRHEENASQLARYLKDHPKIEEVIYPGLESHPQHKLAQKQMSGFGGMLSFKLKGDLNHALKFLKALKIFFLAESLGGVESLIEHPATMTHASVNKEYREKIGITDNLIRVSVGIEHIQDLLDDFEQALQLI